jgi:hypothetical protein
MKRISFLIAAVFLFGAALCYADNGIAQANIPFSFVAGERAYPAGNYQFITNDSETAMLIRNAKPDVMEGSVVILTRLGERPQEHGSIVFDVRGKDCFLSEIHVSGIDGFCLNVVSTKHSHKTVEAKKIQLSVR